jgi:hypothetical protein
VAVVEGFNPKSDSKPDQETNKVYQSLVMSTNSNGYDLVVVDHDTDVFVTTFGTVTAKDTIDTIAKLNDKAYKYTLTGKINTTIRKRANTDMYLIKAEQATGIKKTGSRKS